jgi:hypothetical protein
MTHAYHMRALIGALKPDYSFSLTQTLNAPRRDTYH